MVDGIDQFETVAASNGGTMQRPLIGQMLAGLMLASFALAAAPAGAAYAIKIGLSKSTTAGGIFIAQEKGYFAAESLDPEFVLFDSSEPIAVAVASGSVDFGHTGASAGLYSLSGQGALKIIAAASREAPGFRVNGIAASNRAYDAGLRSLKDLGGHSIAISQFGSPPHYSLVLIEEKYGVDAKSTVSRRCNPIRTFSRR
jgi:NitT/TauT family transport system substrate-binding protein